MFIIGLWFILRNKMTTRHYKVPIEYSGKVVGYATFYRDRLPKDPNFYFLMDTKCMGSFDKRIIKEYKILKLIIAIRKIVDF